MSEWPLPVESPCSRIRFILSFRWSLWMSFHRLFLSLLLGSCALLPTSAQSPESYRGMLTARVRAKTLPAPKHLKDYIQDGKLTLGLRDAILLTLENNSNVQIEETQIEAQKFTLLNQFAPFDASLQGYLNINRNSSLGYTQLQGVGVSTNATLNSLTQIGQLTYAQTFSTGYEYPGTDRDHQVLYQQLLLLLQPILRLHPHLHVHSAAAAGRGPLCKHCPHQDRAAIARTITFQFRSRSQRCHSASGDAILECRAGSGRSRRAAKISQAR